MVFALKQVSLAALSAIALTLANARACEIEISASIWKDTRACQSSSDLQKIGDQSLQMAAKCIELKQGQHVYIESAPLGDFLCVRPIDRLCYWAYTSAVAPNGDTI